MENETETADTGLLAECQGPSLGTGWGNYTVSPELVEPLAFPVGKEPVKVLRVFD